MKEFTHLCFGERKMIEKLLKRGKGIRYISRKLDRGCSSISEEIKNNSTRGVYNAKKAQHKSDVKRAQSKKDCLKVSMNIQLQNFVITSMKNDDQSPTGISGRLKNVDTHITYASSKAIYKYIASPLGRPLEQYLHSNAVKKKPGPKRGIKVNIDGRKFIDLRPLEANMRVEFGHFEGDFIESGKDGIGSLLVLVERKTRYPFLVYLEDKSTLNVNRLIQEQLAGVDVKSLTLDNDISFQKHPELSELINATIYFCHAHHPEEKGTVENRNKSIRRYVKKRSDISKYSESFITEVQRKLRVRFMECLNFKTPQEVFDIEIQAQKNPQVCGILQERLLIK